MQLRDLWNHSWMNQWWAFNSTYELSNYRIYTFPHLIFYGSLKATGIFSVFLNFIHSLNGWRCEFWLYTHSSHIGVNDLDLLRASLKILPNRLTLLTMISGFLAQTRVPLFWNLSNGTNDCVWEIEFHITSITVIISCWDFPGLHFH